MSSLSVLILAYNHAAYLRQCVESALRADIDDLDIHILDDGSTDATAEIGAGLAAAHPGKVFFETQDNSGHIPQNFNKLLSRAKAPFLIMMAADDFFPAPWRVKHRLARFQDDEKCVLAICQGTRCDKEGRQLPASALSRDVVAALKEASSSEILEKHLLDHPFSFFLQGSIMNTRFLSGTGGFDERFIADDLAFNYKIFQEMVKAGTHHRFDDEFGWCYRLHDSNEHRNNLRQLQRRAEVYGHFIPGEKLKNFEAKIYKQLTLFDADELNSDAVRNIIQDNISAEMAARLIRKANWRLFRRALRSGSLPYAYGAMSRLTTRTRNT